MKKMSIGAGQVWLVFLLLLVEALTLQWVGGAYASGFGQHPDEAAHFVSAVMVHDFLENMVSGHPLAFAKHFYLFYPKVAIGNWPPLMYLLMAGWFFIFGISRASSLWFIAVAAAGAATLIYLAGRKLLSREAGFFAAIIYLALPLVQESTAGVMTEHLVTLLILASSLLFARFARSCGTRDAVLFALSASAAILTRGSAWALVFVPPVVIVLTRDWRLLLNWRLWLAALLVGVLCVPWYVATRGMANGAMVGTDPAAPTAFFLQACELFPLIVAQSIGWVLSALTLLGAWRTLLGPERSRSPYWAALAGMLAGVLLLHCIVPAAIEPRYMVQLLPVVLLFAGAGVAAIFARLSEFAAWRPAGGRAAWAGAALLAMLLVFSVPGEVRNQGYVPVAQALMAQTRGLAAPGVLLISDAIGEGSIIAAVATLDQRPHTLVLRGTKVLVSEDWLGRNTRVRFSSDDDIRSLLDSIPVSALVIDHATDKRLARPYRQQVERIVAADPGRWTLSASYDVTRRGQFTPGAVDVYVRRPQPGQSLAATDMRYVEELMRRQ